MEVLRRKVEFLQLRNVDVVVGDASELDLADGSVDVVVSNLGINNFDNAEVVLRECHRVLRPGGRLLISTNLVGHMAEFYDVFGEVLDRLGQDRKPLDEHVKHRATVAGTLALLESAGFTATVAGTPSPSGTSTAPRSSTTTSSGSGSSTAGRRSRATKYWRPSRKNSTGAAR